ncbi:MAG: type III-A CRISPR-associated RAMP protein Csm5, partial [Candidatus Marinimicrobia bacterium]|nr:type III-A CRISPR-associated RAMP protein Csm5 [Candidatus Neomarinimicrobiota bacterium]
MNISQKYRITILSPVHIGSGRKLISGFDFYYDDRTRQTWLYDLDEICRLVSDNRKAIDELSTITGKTGESIHDFVRKYQIASNLKKTRSFSLQTYSKDLLEYIRDGLGNPLIPGSSIKGSLRSAYTYTLFNGLDKSKQQRLLEGVKGERRDKFAAQKIEKELFGEEPNTDIFKAITVTDVGCSGSDIQLGNTKVLSLSQYGGWHWK